MRHALLVLIAAVMIKTNLTVPYTTVFLDLDCGYWSPESEAKMRQAMKGKLAQAVSGAPFLASQSRLTTLIRTPHILF